MAEATARYAAAMPGSPAAEYLKTRGLVPDSQISFQLGHVADPLPGHERYRGMLAVPYLTPAGPVAIRFRRLPGPDGKTAQPKYLSEPGDGMRLFNVAAFGRTENFLCVCEGELDTVAVTQAGLPAVGVPGAEAWRPFFPYCFKGYEAVFVLADTDDKGAGMNLAEKVAASVEGARIVPMPGEHDANSFLLANGRDALFKLIGVDHA